MEELLRLGEHPLRQCFWHHSRPKKGGLVRCRKDVKGSDLVTRTSAIRQIPDIAEIDTYYGALKALAPLVLCALHRKPSDRVNEIYEYWISVLKIRFATDIHSKPILRYSNNDQDYSISQVTLATSSQELHQQVPHRHQNLLDLASIQHGENSRQSLASHFETCKICHVDRLSIHLRNLLEPLHVRIHGSQIYLRTCLYHGKASDSVSRENAKR